MQQIWPILAKGTVLTAAPILALKVKALRLLDQI
jgi:hypothetical protein